MISVCIATYNGEKYIKEELESILPQLADDDEVVISDDGSKDQTISIIEGLNDKRIKIFTHQKQPAKFRFDYTTHNFENALMHTKGDVIFFADQDDVWLPNKCKVMMEALETADIAVSNCSVVDENLNEQKLLFDGNEKRTCRILPNLINPNNTGCCMAFKRNVLNTVLPFPKYGVAQDVWVAVFGGIYHKLTYIDTPLILFRRHSNNVSASAGKSKDSLIYKIGYRWNTLCSLIKRAGFFKVLINL